MFPLILYSCIGSLSFVHCNFNLVQYMHCCYCHMCKSKVGSWLSLPQWVFNIVLKCNECPNLCLQVRQKFSLSFPHQESNVMNVVMQQLYCLLPKEVIDMNHTYHAKSSVLCKWICEWLNSYLSYCLLMAYLNSFSAYQFPKAPVLQPLALIPLVTYPSNLACTSRELEFFFTNYHK